MPKARRERYYAAIRATKKSPAQLQREIDEVLANRPLTTAQRLRLVFGRAMRRSRPSPGRRSHSTMKQIDNRAIKALMEKAIAAKDWERVGLCERALGIEELSPENTRAESLTRDEARAECAKVIAA
jgi:hypothetical protein